MNNCINIKIKNEVLSNLGINKDAYFALLNIHFNNDYQQGVDWLLSKGYITRYGVKNRSGFVITREGCDLIEEVQSKSSLEKETLDRTIKIAKQLKALYPKGKKDGTSYYWADGVALIAKRLAIFFKKYGDIYTDSQIVDATRRYVQSFNGNYTFMKLLKYFIFKEEVGAAGDVESTSELLTFIENKSEGDGASRNDFAELR